MDQEEEFYEPDGRVLDSGDRTQLDTHTKVTIAGAACGLLATLALALTGVLLIVGAGVFMTYLLWSHNPVIALLITLASVVVIVLTAGGGVVCGIYLYKNDIHRKYMRVDKQVDDPAFVTQFTDQDI